MKKINLLSRAEMRKVVGGNPVVLGCEVNCYMWSADNPRSTDGYWPVNHPGRFRILTQSCSAEHILEACGLASAEPESCGNCTIDHGDVS